jgi:hypothetical protein
MQPQLTVHEPSPSTSHGGQVALIAAVSNETHPGPSQTKLSLDRSALEKLLMHAASAARIAGSIDDVAIGPLADEIDAIAYELSELLGNPDLIDEPMRSTCPTFAPNVSTREGDIIRDDDAATEVNEP